MQETRKTLARYIVCGPSRPNFTYYFVAGRGFSKEPLEIEVVDGDTEPQDECTLEDGRKEWRISIRRMTQKSFETILADKLMTVRPVDVAGSEHLKVNVVELVKESDELRAENLRLRDKLAYTEKQLQQAQQLLDEATKPDIKDLRGKGRRASA